MVSRFIYKEPLPLYYQKDEEVLTGRQKRNLRRKKKNKK